MTSLFSNPLAFVVGALVIIVIALIIVIFHMHAKLRRFLIAIDSENIKDSLTFVGDGLKDLQKFRDDTALYLDTVEKRLKKSVQSVHTVRFNPFQGEGFGGNQSFATAFLNEDGDGVIISSLYSRDRVSIFSKPIKNSASGHELSDEEAEALDRAKNKLK